MTTSKFTRNYSHLVLITVKARKIIRYASVQVQRQSYSSQSRRERKIRDDQFLTTLLEEHLRVMHYLRNLRRS